MNWIHSPWPLFCNDLDQARAWINPQLQGAVPRRTGHLAISLGLGTELLHGIQSESLQADLNSLRQWQFRMARLHKDRNPYRYLLSDELLKRILITLENSEFRKRVLGVELNGGIGDHLEALSLILPWAQSKDFHIDLVMSEERYQQLNTLIPQTENIECITSNKIRSETIPVMAMRAALAEQSNSANYHIWIPSTKDTKQIRNYYLCCWRAEGFGDKFSAHSRSVPWETVRDFYLDLLRINHQPLIYDITRWTEWEKHQLQAMGVRLIDPRKGSLLDLIKRCRTSRVITIDTALAHLCAASGVKANLLLSLFADERWHELHRPENNYGQLLKIWRSSQFGSWSDVLSSLTKSFATEN